MKSWCGIKVGLAIIMLVCSILQSAYAGTLYVASASNFKPALEQLITLFSQQTGHSVHATYGSSGKLFLQIQHGAPYDLFFSADTHKPLRLVQTSYAEKEFQRTYAIGRLALWSNKSGVELQNGKFLHSKQLTRLALADGKLAPYGVAAEQTLESLSAHQSTSNKWVVAHSVIQAFHFVSTGNVDAGFIPVSFLISQQIAIDEQVWIVPDQLYSPVRQDMVLLSRSQRNPAAIQFWQFIQSAQAKAVITSYGYGIME